MRLLMKEPLKPYDISDVRWEMVGVDLFVLQRQSFLIAVDYYSGHFDVQDMRSTISTRVISVLKSWYSRHGIPMTLISDNGPPFNSKDFKAFGAEWDFHHVTSSPYHPQSNGRAEKAVKTCKSLLCPCWQSWPLAGVTWMAQHSIWRHECVSRSATGDFTNQNATHPETSPEVVCSQRATLRMLGAKLQRVFFTFKRRGWYLQRSQKTWVVSTEFYLELNFLFLPYRQNCFCQSTKVLFIVKNTKQTF